MIATEASLTSCHHAWRLSFGSSELGRFFVVFIDVLTHLYGAPFVHRSNPKPEPTRAIEVRDGLGPSPSVPQMNGHLGLNACTRPPGTTGKDGTPGAVGAIGTHLGHFIPTLHAEGGRVSVVAIVTATSAGVSSGKPTREGTHSLTASVMTRRRPPWSDTRSGSFVVKPEATPRGLGPSRARHRAWAR